VLSAVTNAVHVLELSFLISLREKIVTVTVEGVVNVGGGDCIEIKADENYIQLVGRVKCEQEVSVLCCVGVFCCVIYLHVCFIVFELAYRICSVSACEAARCTCVLCCCI
jgi:hypothetical protein